MMFHFQNYNNEYRDYCGAKIQYITNKTAENRMIFFILSIWGQDRFFQDIKNKKIIVLFNLCIENFNFIQCGKIKVCVEDLL